MAIVKVNPSNPAELLIESASGKTFTYGSTGLFEGTTKITGADMHGPLGEVLNLVKESPASIDSGVKSVLNTHLPSFKGNVADEALLKEVTSGVKFAEDIKAKAAALTVGADGKATGAGIKSIRTRLITNPLSEQLLDEATKKNLLSKGFDWEVFNKIKDASKTLGDLVSAEAPDVNAIRKHLIDNLEHAEELVGTVQRTGGTDVLYKVGKQGANLMSMPAEITKKIGEDVVKAKAAAQEIVNLDGRIKSIEAIKNPSKAQQESLKTLKESLAKQNKAFGELLEGDYAKRVAVDLDKNAKTLMENAGKVSTEVSSRMSTTLKAAEAGMSTAVKDGGIFTRTAKELAELAVKKEVAVKDIGFWGRRNMVGKGAIIAGIAAIGYAIVAAVSGNKGPGENADRVRQGQGQAAGIGA